MSDARVVTVVDLYTLQIVSLDGKPLTPTPLLDAIMLEAEENISDLLPFGFRAVIRRWNAPGPDEGNDDA